jgi:hypothetical protein
VARRSFATTIFRQHPRLEKKSAAYARTAEVSAALPPDRQEGQSCASDVHRLRPSSSQLTHAPNHVLPRFHGQQIAAM